MGNISRSVKQFYKNYRFLNIFPWKYRCWNYARIKLNLIKKKDDAMAS